MKSRIGPMASGPDALAPAGGVETTEDAFLGGRLTVRQPAKGYRAGLDAVLLAASVHSDDGALVRVLDMGCGVGTVGLCLAWRCRGVSVVGIEVQPALAELARCNAAANGLADRAEFLTGDVTEPVSELLRHDALQVDGFDRVVINPPFYRIGEGRPSTDAGRATSHMMDDDGLDVWLRRAVAFLRPGGRLSLVHRPDRLGELIQVLDGRCGDLRVRFLHPREGDHAHRLLLSGVKGSRAPLQVLDRVVLHGSGNAFRPEIRACLADGAAFPMR